MSNTHPYGQPQGAAKSVTNRLREAMIAELIAMNGYQEHILNSNMPEINAVFMHILEDEKRHYNMFLALLRKYDPAEYKMYRQVQKEHEPGRRSPLQPYRPMYSQQIICNNIRADIKGELEAVILYEQGEEDVSQQDIRETFQSIADEEKEHTEHLTALLQTYETYVQRSL